MSKQTVSHKLEHLEKLIAKLLLLQKPVLNFNEAAEYLRISRSHLSELTGKNQISHLHIRKGKIYFNRIDLDKWLHVEKRKHFRDRLKKFLLVGKKIFKWLFDDLVTTILSSSIINF